MLAIVAAAALFAAGRLPAVKYVWPRTLRVVAHVMMLKGVPGVLFGVLYWRCGFEHAVVGHFAADLAIHVVGAG